MIFLELISCTIAGWLLYETSIEVQKYRCDLQAISIDCPVEDIARSAIENGLSNLQVRTIDPDVVDVDSEEITQEKAIGILLNNRRSPTPSVHYNNVNRKHPILELTNIRSNLDSALQVIRGLAQAERDRDGLNPKKGLIGRALLLTLVFTVPLWEYANDNVAWDVLQTICTVITVAHALLLYRDWWDTQRDLNTRSHQIAKTAGITGLGEIPAVHNYFSAQRRQMRVEAIAIPVAIAVALTYHYV